MLQGNQWNSFFNNIDNKYDLVKLIVHYFKQYKVKQKLTVPVLVNDSDHTWEAANSTVRQVFPCNHEEADTRLVLHCTLQDTANVIISTDTDVLILLTFMFYLTKPVNDWCMKIEKQKFFDIRKIAQFLGDKICKYLPDIHSLTGCDTTSYPYGISNIKALKKLRGNDQLLDLLNKFGKVDLTEEVIFNVMEFFRSVCYSGKSKESLVETRATIISEDKNKEFSVTPC